VPLPAESSKDKPNKFLLIRGGIYINPCNDGSNIVTNFMDKMSHNLNDCNNSA